MKGMHYLQRVPPANDLALNKCGIHEQTSSCNKSRILQCCHTICSRSFALHLTPATEPSAIQNLQYDVSVDIVWLVQNKAHALEMKPQPRTYYCSHAPPARIRRHSHSWRSRPAASSQVLARQPNHQLDLLCSPSPLPPAVLQFHSVNEEAGPDSLNPGLPHPPLVQVLLPPLHRQAPLKVPAVLCLVCVSLWVRRSLGCCVRGLGCCWRWDGTARFLRPGLCALGLRGCLSSLAGRRWLPTDHLVLCTIPAETNCLHAVILASTYLYMFWLLKIRTTETKFCFESQIWRGLRLAAGQGGGGGGRTPQLGKNHTDCLIGRTHLFGQKLTEC
jgi:hypothetical protein